jgi:hypothetical protein
MVIGCEYNEGSYVYYMKICNLSIPLYTFTKMLSLLSPQFLIAGSVAAAAANKPIKKSMVCVQVLMFLVHSWQYSITIYLCVIKQFLIWIYRNTY